MKCADVIAEFLSHHVKHVFVISGGASLHIIHGIAKRDDLKFICPQNEQSASFAADAYARLTGFGCAVATSGPGATNLLTGIATSYYDSVPVLYLTGQQTLERLGTGMKVRQYGFQCTPIVDMVKPITKYATMITSAKGIRGELEIAYKIATSKRPGPVLIDIPDDIQRAEI